MADLLFELGTEELPARFVVPALQDLEKLFVEQCAAARITHGAITVFGTPRRLALLVQGLANKLIARRLGITERTVKAHLTNIFQRLGVTDRTQAALRAREPGLL